MVAATGAIDERSQRAAGHSGLAQRRGFRNTAALLQSVTSESSGSAHRQLRASRSVFDTPEASPGGSVLLPGEGEGDDGERRGDPAVVVWQEPVTRALSDGGITLGQFDAIMSGLGVPPDGRAGDWYTAARELVVEAAERTVEELRRAARTVRDLLDPVGAHERFARRYEQRSFKFWTDRDGVTRASLVFDDEGAQYVRTIFDTALRPRKGGPRFVPSDEQAAAKSLSDDARTNEQLAFDLCLDLIRVGALADSATVYGTRQAGLRLVRVVDADQAGVPVTGGRVDEDLRGAAVTLVEDTGDALPAGAAARQVCNAGIVPVTVDPRGNPLDVGRESRLFTPAQRIGLAIRDGGCRWPGCDRPASYCEAHHIDEWAADHGRTDIDRGILLCAFHHKQLHNNAWRITRDEKADFLLHPPRQRPSEHETGPGKSAEARTGNGVGSESRAGVCASPPPRRLPVRAARTSAWAHLAAPAPRFTLAA